MTDKLYPIESAREAALRVMRKYGSLEGETHSMREAAKALYRAEMAGRMFYDDDYAAKELPPECRPPEGAEPGPWFLRHSVTGETICAEWSRGKHWYRFDYMGPYSPEEMGKQLWLPFAPAIPATERRKYSDDEALALLKVIWRDPMRINDAIPLFARALLAGKGAADFRGEKPTCKACDGKGFVPVTAPTAGTAWKQCRECGNPEGKARP